MLDFKNILVATDTRLDVHAIVDEAALIAQQGGASIKLVDVVPEFPWIVRLSLNDHQAIREALINEKRERLVALAEPLRQRGISVDIEVLSGKTSVEIIRQASRGDHDLVMRVAKGKYSRRKGYFGTTATALLRECPCPVWLVAPTTSPSYKHVMACVDTSNDEPADVALNNRVVDAATRVSRCHQSKISIVHAWSIYGEEFLFGRTRQEDFQNLVTNVRNRSKTLLDGFLQTHARSADDKNVYMMKGHPAAVIPTFASKNKVDLIVMGTVARSWLSGMLIGSTAERILSEINCSVLAIKPDSFVSPITSREIANMEAVA